MRPVLVAVLALLVAPAALAAPPEGFRLSGPLTVRAAKISGTPHATVYCGGYWAWRNVPEWQAADGITRMDSRETFLRADDCSRLTRWLRGQRVSLAQLGDALGTFTHEAQHLRGIGNEMRAECEAMRLVPSIARRYFGVRKASTLRQVVRAARAHTYCPAWRGR